VQAWTYYRTLEEPSSWAARHGYNAAMMRLIAGGARPAGGRGRVELGAEP
jgi:hypothetical protein